MSKETDLNESNEDLKVDQTEAETNVARIIAVSRRCYKTGQNLLRRN